MSGEEFALRRAWDSVSPLDLKERLEAMTASILASVHRDRDQRSAPYSVDDMLEMASIRTQRLTRAQEEQRFREAFHRLGIVRRA
jgi:hypothetical protein